MKGAPLALLLLCSTSLSSFASDGDLTFNGQVVASACTLQGFNGGTMTTGAVMSLATVTPASFVGAGGYAGIKDFSINLKNCDTTTLKNAQVFFNGIHDDLDNSILNNNQTNGPATGVGVSILEDDGTTPVDINGKSPSRLQTLSTGNTELKFKVAYKANTSTPAVSAGSVAAKTFIDIAYQ